MPGMRVGAPQQCRRHVLLDKHGGQEAHYDMELALPAQEASAHAGCNMGSLLTASCNGPVIGPCMTAALTAVQHSMKLACSVPAWKPAIGASKQNSTPGSLFSTSFHM